MKRLSKFIVVLMMMAGFAAGITRADDASHSSLQDYANLSLEQLVNVRVTSVAKKETELTASPAAIFVITPEEIDRSGVTSLPEALRLVPGLDVAQINSSDWAISARGFNSQFANKLLVMVDGRSIYDPAFGGVLWEMQDLVLEDLDRIEVIRGPGATLWGANAVNGVININTKSSRDTQGLLVSTIFGTQDQPITSLRYGFALATNLFARVSVKYANDNDFTDSSGNGTPSAHNILHGGARSDWYPTDGDLVTLQGDYFRADLGGLAQPPTLTPPYFTNFSGINFKTGDNVLARWTHDFSSSSQLTLQAYYDHSADSDANSKDFLDTYDLDLQHHFTLGECQDIVWGAGFRYTIEEAPPSFDLTFTPERDHDHIASAFVQDDLTLVKDRLHAIVGSKFEDVSQSGFEVQPSGRLVWTPSDKQALWGAISRAVRTPSRLDQDVRYNQLTLPPSAVLPAPTLVSIFGDSAFHSEELIAYELGYRLQPNSKLAFDLATYYNVYHDLSIFTPGTIMPEGIDHFVLPEITSNDGSAETYGGELSAQWRVSDQLKLEGSYSYLHMHLSPSDVTAGDSPQHQFQLHAFFNLTRTVELNASLYYVSALPNQGVAAYTRGDLGIVWRPNQMWEVGVWGQNLFDSEHAEFASTRTPVITEIPRTFYGKITFRF